MPNPLVCCGEIVPESAGKYGCPICNGENVAKRKRSSVSKYPKIKQSQAKYVKKQAKIKGLILVRVWCRPETRDEILEIAAASRRQNEIRRSKNRGGRHQV